MLKRKAILYAVILSASTACTKENATLTTESVDAASANNLWWWPRQNPGPDQETIFGLTEEQPAGQSAQECINQNEDGMKEAGVNLTRLSIALSETPVNKMIDNFLASGYDVQIIADWNDGLNGTRGFPTNEEMDLVKSQAEAFFQYYAPYKSQIPFVAVENEWDWQVEHGANLQDYLTELSIITDVGHKYGFTITDGGITSTDLQRWTYSQLSGDEQEQWNEDYWVGLNSGQIDYNYLMNLINTYIAGVQDIDFDFTNVHWCNTTKCSDGFATATQLFMEACNKKSVVCNEFYIRSNSLDLFDSTVNEIKGNTEYAIAYSGTNNDGRAIQLTDAMLQDLH